MRNLLDRGCRRLFEKHVLAGFEQPQRDFGADCRRSADRGGIERDIAVEQRVERGEMRKAVAPLGERIDGGDEREGGVACEGRQVLIAGDLAEANQGDTNGWSVPARLRHSGTTRACGCSAAATSGLRRGSVNGAASISKTSPACVSKPSAKLAVAVPKKCTCTSPCRRNRPYLK